MAWQAGPMLIWRICSRSAPQASAQRYGPTPASCPAPRLRPPISRPLVGQDRCIRPRHQAYGRHRAARFGAQQIGFETLGIVRVSRRKVRTISVDATDLERRTSAQRALLGLQASGIEPLWNAAQRWRPGEAAFRQTKGRNNSRRAALNAKDNLCEPLTAARLPTSCLLQFARTHRAN